MPPLYRLRHGSEGTWEHGTQGWSPGADLELEIFRTLDKRINPQINHWIEAN